MREDWRDHAACRDHDPELFVPQEPHNPSGPTAADPNVHAALAICTQCSVIQDCREFADSITDTPVTGVWGGRYRSRRFAAKQQQLAGIGPYDAVTSRR